MTQSLQLEPAEIIATIQRLRHRIHERLPESGLADVAASLKQIADAAHARSCRMQEPNALLRIGVGVLLAGMAAVAVYVFTQLTFRDTSAWEVLQGIDAAISSIVFLGAAAFFLITAESRLRRRKILTAIEELRELAHLIDMHQLTKDPDRATGRHQATASSPAESLTPFLLSRYLDYCSEMLSLIGKVAVLYTQGSRDAVVLDAIDAVEDLTTGLSRKIWQKLIILDRITGTMIESTPSAKTSEAPPVVKS